jgi:hypothetical protein
MIRPTDERRDLVGFQCCLKDAFQLATVGECHRDYASFAIDSKIILPYKTLTSGGRTDAEI